MSGGADSSVFSPLVSTTPEVLYEQTDQVTGVSQGLLKRIEEIDREEKDLYKVLLKASDDIREIKEVQQQDPSKLSSNTKQSLKQELETLTALQKSVRTQIESLGKMRIQLYRDLGKRYTDLQTVVDEDRNALVDQKTSADIMGGELANLEGEYGSLRQEKARKARLTEIDTYYSKRYESYADLMKLISYVCVPLLLVAIVFRMDYIGEGIRSALVVIVLVIGGYLVFLKSMDIWYRDNMNWDEYRWSFDGEKGGESVWEYDRDHLKGLRRYGDKMVDDVSKTLGFACVNEQCCRHPKVVWDKKRSKCVMKDGSSSGGGKGHKDGFRSMNAAPMCPVGKALGAKVNESCGVSCDLVNLAQNFCGGSPDGSTVLGFDGF